MGDFRHHITLILSNLGVKELNYRLISQVRWHFEKLTVAKTFDLWMLAESWNGLRGTSITRAAGTQGGNLANAEFH